MALPDFLIVGFPRCGTSFLMKTLPMHPGIYMPEKETGFFQNPNFNTADYISLFPEDKLNGEKTPTYIYSKKAMSDIHELTPNVKILVCIRHPIQALHSFYAHRVREYKLGHSWGFDPKTYSFTDIVLNDLDVNQVSISNYNFMFFIRENVLPLFNRKQIKIVVNEEMRQDTKTILHEIFDLLHLKDEDLELKPIKNYDEQHKYDCIHYDTIEYKQALQKLIDYYQPSVYELYDYLGREIASWKTFDSVYAKMLN